MNNWLRYLSILNYDYNSNSSPFLLEILFGIGSGIGIGNIIIDVL